MQIRSRLTLRFILIVAFILQLSLFFIYFKFRSYIEDEFYNSLKSKAFMTAEMLVNQSNIEPSINSVTQSSFAFQLPSRENFIIYNNQLEKIYAFNQTASNEIPLSLLNQIKTKGEYRFKHANFNALGVSYTNKYNRKYIIISEAVFDSNTLFNLRNILIFDFFLIIAFVAISGWIFAGQALTPVSNIMNQMDKILPSDLSERLESSSNKDELSRLALTFNNLLDRIQYAFNIQKSFLSNVSHELKNPLTVIISQIEVILDKARTNDEYHKTLESVLEDVKELHSVSDQLMLLARINANNDQIEFEKLRLDEMIWQTKESLTKNHPTYKINFDVNNLPTDPDKLYIKGNEQLLKTALMNLFDNGCKFSSDHTINVRIKINNTDQIAIEIIDNGPGISNEEKAMIFQPFYRSPNTNDIRGSGIGLSLVDSILKLHIAKLDIEPGEFKGSIFKITMNTI
ncbi:MAG TPA: HAMP domain-containing sensor histidine kinase [Saprospiraceae bacterium]|nr:HAMP domain-containing sensor histidine kinase [Saprospiraceae bacterium]